MEKITNHAPNSANENKIGCTSFRSPMCNKRMGMCDGCPVNEAAWERLAAYEDTGLTPEACTVLNGLRFVMQKEMQRLQERIHAQKRDNRRLHTERNLAISLLQEAIKGKDFYPCDSCRSHRSGTCEQPLCKNYSRWAWKGVHDGNGGNIDAEHTGRSQ